MYRRVLVLLSATLLLTTAGASAASAVTNQQRHPGDPLVVVESFLAARNAGDPWGATGWCAELLELQDVDGQWFVESPTTSDWLRQLTDRYLLDTMSPLIVEGDTVTWSERLTLRRGQFPDAWSNGMTLDVSAVVRDGRISYLSAPYPPFPLRSPAVLADEPGRNGPPPSSPGPAPG